MCTLWSNAKTSTYFARHSPNASLVYELMCDATGDEKMMHIKENDHICETCYRAQLAILRFVERKGSDLGTDEQLMDLIEIWKCKLACEDINAVDNAIFHAVLHVANEILHLRAVLLPCVCNLFIAAYSANDEQDINLEVGEGTVKFTSRWLLNQIILHLETFIKYKCIHKKFGILIFRAGGDILTIISWALGRAQMKHKDSEEQKSTYNPTFKNNRDSVLREAANIVNDLLHAEIAKQKSEDIYTQDDPCRWNVDQYVCTVDPLLWKFLEEATSTLQQKKSNVVERSNEHKKKYADCTFYACYYTVQTPKNQQSYMFFWPT